MCDEHRCAFDTTRKNRCTDIVAQGPLELHARARKNRPTTTNYCKTHFGIGEQKRKGESETRPSRAIKKVIVESPSDTCIHSRARLAFINVALSQAVMRQQDHHRTLVAGGDD